MGLKGFPFRCKEVKEFVMIGMLVGMGVVWVISERERAIFYFGQFCGVY